MRNERAIYVAGPVTSKINGNRQAFEDIAVELRANGWEPYLPIDHPRSAECLAESQRLGNRYRAGEVYRALMTDFLHFIIDEASALYLLPDWMNTSAEVEFQVAVTLGLPVYGNPEDIPTRPVERAHHVVQSGTDRVAFKPDLDRLPPLGDTTPIWPARQSPWSL